MENRRNFFRIPFVGEIVVVFDSETGLTFDAEIKDVSGMGISFSLSRLEELKQDGLFHLIFTLEKVEFKRKAVIVRKIEKGNIIYACKFVGNTEKENAELSSHLFRIDAIRKKK